VTRWQVRRQDDNGNEYVVASYDDRVQAVARVLTFEAGQQHKQLYWVDGPAEPALRTNRDLYSRLIELGRGMGGTGRTLDELLRSWWWAGQALAGHAELELDSVAAMFMVAATAQPPALLPSWRTSSFAIADGLSYRDWEAVLLSQIADLADLAEAGPMPQWASLGIDVVRPPGVSRATGPRWYNVEPSSYLECGVAGSLGGDDPADGLRVAVPGDYTPLRPEPEPGVRELPVLSWADLVELAVCGQQYE
jgi:hypothetical protein